MTPATRPKLRRADHRRNNSAILRAAAVLVERDGAQASLEAIARDAGVGSATLHRHFRSRRDLLQAVFDEQLRRICERAGELAGEDDPELALRRWLLELAAFTAANRGLGAAVFDETIQERSGSHGCHALVHDSARNLFDAAHAAGSLRDGVALEDLLALTEAIASAHEGFPDTARRLVDLALCGALRRGQGRSERR